MQINTLIFVNFGKCANIRQNELRYVITNINTRIQSSAKETKRFYAKLNKSE